MAKLIRRKTLNSIVAHLDATQAALEGEQQRQHARASSRLAAHRDTGAAQVTMSSGDVDKYVNLEDPAALSIQFGHWVGGKYETETPKFVPGLYILSTDITKAGPRRKGG